MTIVLAGLLLVLVYSSFAVSATAGLGGSLILVPTMVAAVGAKEGVALAALLLAGNNVLKVAAYRRSLPLRKAVGVILLITVGAVLGSALLVHAPTPVVAAAIVGTIASTLALEGAEHRVVSRRLAPVLALSSGATSGFSGTSGPLKGIAIRCLQLDRRHFVGAASLASLAGDVSKTAVFTGADVLGRSHYLVAAAAVPLMLAGTFTGRVLNDRFGERRFALFFWTVMGGYSVRLVALAA